MTPDKPQVKTYAVPTPMLQEIFAYLQTKPWGEVNGMVTNIINLVQAESNAQQQGIVMPSPPPAGGNGRDAAHPEAR